MADPRADAPAPEPLRTPPPAATAPASAARAAKRSRALALKENLVAIDVAALVLAAASLVILLTWRTVELDGPELAWLQWIDYAAIAVFALLFVGKLLGADYPLRYLRRHFWDAFGLLPITHPLLGLDRWWTIVGIAIVVARLSAGLDRAFGERVLAPVLERYRFRLVEELTVPILVRLLVILENALRQGRYTDAMGRRLEARRAEVREIVQRSLEASPKIALLRKVPGVDRKLDELVEELVTSAVTALTSEEMNRLVGDALADAIADLEKEIVKPHWKARGLGISDIARGLMGNPRA